MKAHWFWLIAGVLTLMLASIVSAQAQSCPEIVQRAYVSIDQHCTTTERNEACYGNLAIEAEPQYDISDFEFTSVGDIEAVSNIDSMHLFDLNEDEGIWGVALMRLQANLPDTLPGQNALVVLFGDVNMENITANDDTHAFYLHTGLGRPRCSEVPQSGILIQSPDGADEVMLNINGTDVALGSTVLFQTTEDEFIVTTVEGSAVAMFDEQAYPAIAGSRIHMPIDENGTIVGRPSWPEPYNWDDVAALPIGILDREIEIAPPMTASQINEVIDHLMVGDLPCGEDGLPECDSMLPVINRSDALPGGDDWDGNPPEYAENGDDTIRPANVDTPSSNPNDWRDGDPTDGNAGLGNDENFVPPGQSEDVSPPASDNSNAGGNSGGGASPPSGGNNSGGGNSGSNDNNNGGGHSSASADSGASGGSSGDSGNSGNSANSNSNSGNNGNSGGNSGNNGKGKNG